MSNHRIFSGSKLVPLRAAAVLPWSSAVQVAGPQLFCSRKGFDVFPTAPWKNFNQKKGQAPFFQFLTCWKNLYKEVVLQPILPETRPRPAASHVRPDPPVSCYPDTETRPVTSQVRLENIAIHKMCFSQDRSQKAPATNTNRTIRTATGSTPHVSLTSCEGPPRPPVQRPLVAPRDSWALRNGGLASSLAKSSQNSRVFGSQSHPFFAESSWLVLKAEIYMIDGCSNIPMFKPSITKSYATGKKKKTAVVPVII